MSIADLRATLEYVKTHQQEYDPTVWFSGTTADIAGHLVLRAGWTPLETDELRISPPVVKGDKARAVHLVAAELAGVSVWEGQCLWTATATIDRLETMVRRLEADQSIYELLSLPTTAFQHAWTNSRDRIMVAAHRRTSYFRIGDTIEIKDWDGRYDAVEYARAVATGRILTHHESPED